MYAQVERMSQSGSSLKPPPMSALPFLVSGWYWWKQVPSESWVEAMSRMRWRARAGQQVDEAEDVLVGVAIAHAAADAGLVAGGRARKVERGHALDLVPGVDHAAQVLVGDLGRLVDREQGSSQRALTAAKAASTAPEVGILRENFLALGLVHHDEGASNFGRSPCST
jgi:hypothetical protein